MHVWLHLHPHYLPHFPCTLLNTPMTRWNSLASPINLGRDMNYARSCLSTGLTNFYLSFRFYLMDGSTHMFRIPLHELFIKGSLYVYLLLNKILPLVSQYKFFPHVPLFWFTCHNGFQSFHSISFILYLMVFVCWSILKHPSCSTPLLHFFDLNVNIALSSTFSII